MPGHCIEGLSPFLPPKKMTRGPHSPPSQREAHEPLRDRTHKAHEEAAPPPAPGPPGPAGGDPGRHRQARGLQEPREEGEGDQDRDHHDHPHEARALRCERRDQQARAVHRGRHPRRGHHRAAGVAVRWRRALAAHPLRRAAGPGPGRGLQAHQLRHAPAHLERRPGPAGQQLHEEPEGRARPSVGIKEVPLRWDLCDEPSLQELQCDSPGVTTTTEASADAVRRSTTRF